MTLAKRIRKLFCHKGYNNLGQEETKIKIIKIPSQAFNALTPEDKLKLLTETIVIHKSLTAVGLGSYSAEEIRNFSNELRGVIYGILESGTIMELQLCNFPILILFSCSLQVLLATVK